MASTKHKNTLRKVTDFFAAKPLLSKGVEIVTFLFTIFGSFLIEFAPPGVDTTRNAVGLTSLITLAVLLLISALARYYATKSFRILWFAIVVASLSTAIFFGFRYSHSRNQYTFAYPPGTTMINTIGGIEMLPDAEEEMKENGWDKSTLLAEHGPEFINTIWTEASINEAKEILFRNYFIFVISIAVALFSLTERLLSKPKS